VNVMKAFVGCGVVCVALQVALLQNLVLIYQVTGGDCVISSCDVPMA
jgi:hypothetical protein